MPAAATGVIRVVDQDTRDQEAAAEAKPLLPRQGVPEITIPKTEATMVAVPFSLSTITDLGPYRELGRRLAQAGSDVLQRRLLDAKVIHTDGDKRRTQLVTPTAADSVTSAVDLLPLDAAREVVVREVREHRVVPGREGEGEHVARLVDAVIEGAGGKAAELLSRFPSRVAIEIALVIGQVAAGAPKSQITTTVSFRTFAPKAQNLRPDATTDLVSKFRPRVAYTGWQRCMYDQAWFDSEPERHLGMIADADESVEVWTRLYRGDLPILWNGAANEYNPDFLVLTTDGDAWIVEVKSDKDASSASVQAKRQAALEWVNTVNAHKETDRRWHYVLATETDLATAAGSWATLVSSSGM